VEDETLEELERGVLEKEESEETDASELDEEVAFWAQPVIEERATRARREKK
jgi:hypothetical protein